MPHADLDDVRLHYEFDGPADKPVLALSNSLGTNLHMWDPVMPALSGDYRVLRYDMRGHGESTVSPGLYTIPHLAEDLLSLTDTLGIKQFFFCGLSVGGMIGIWLGIHAAHRLKKLVLANTAARIGTRKAGMIASRKSRAAGSLPSQMASSSAGSRLAFVRRSPGRWRPRARCCWPRRRLDMLPQVPPFAIWT